MRLGASLSKTIITYRSITEQDMEEPILNAHNKAEYEPAHTAGFDTRQTLCSNTCCQNLDMKK